MKFLYIGGGVGIVWTVLAAILGWLVIPSLVKKKIGETVALKNHSEAYEKWVDVPTTIRRKYYVFEVLNRDEIPQGVKPIVRERGPYVYDIHREKLNLKLFEDEDRGFYYNKMRFEFNAELSNGTEDDMVTVLNPPVFGYIQIADSLPGFGAMLPIFNDYMKKMWDYDDVFFPRVRVGDYIIDGIKMNCKGNEGSALDRLFWQLFCLAYDILHSRTAIINDGEIGINTFSFAKYLTLEESGPFEVRLGIDEPEKLGQIITFEGKNNTGAMWGGGHCSEIRGSENTLYRPFLHDEDTISVFNTDIMRTVNLTYEGDVEFKGVPGRRYGATRKWLASVTENPDNYCFCPRSVKGATVYGGCLRTGLLDVSSCHGSPFYLSLPHFLHADELYQNMVVGLEPDPEKHSLFVELEPHTGYPLRGASRVQINVFLKRMPQMEALKNFSNTLIPIIWFEEGAELTDELISEINEKLLDVMSILDIVKWTILIIGIVIAVAAGIGLIMKSNKAKTV